MNRLAAVMLAGMAMGAFLPAPAMAGGDPAKGRIVFARCMACHKVDRSGTNGLGPNLHGVIGRPVASVRGYAYSPAMAKKGGSWTPAELDLYLSGPARAVPGTKMIFTGLPRAEDRANLLAWLAAASR